MKCLSSDGDARSAVGHVAIGWVHDLNAYWEKTAMVEKVIKG